MSDKEESQKEAKIVFAGASIVICWINSLMEGKHPMTMSKTRLKAIIINPQDQTIEEIEYELTGENNAPSSETVTEEEYVRHTEYILPSVSNALGAPCNPIDELENGDYIFGMMDMDENQSYLAFLHPGSEIEFFGKAVLVGYPSDNLTDCASTVDELRRIIEFCSPLVTSRLRQIH